MRLVWTIAATVLLAGGSVCPCQAPSSAQNTNSGPAVPSIPVASDTPPSDVRPATYRDIVEGVQNGQWIEVHGVVHSAAPTGNGMQALSLKIEMDGGPIGVLLQDPANLDPRSLVDAVVRVRGIYSTALNNININQTAGTGLVITDPSNLTVEKPAPADPFAIQAIPVRDVVQFGAAWRAGHRIKVHGVVAYQGPDHLLYIQDGNDGIEVRVSADEHVDQGKRVEAVGFPAIGDFAPELRDATVRVTGAGTPVVAQKLKASAVITLHPGFSIAPHEQLATLEGEVVESYLQEHKRVWVLRQDDTVYEAHLPLTDGDVSSKYRSPGAVIRLTGIVRVHADANRNPTSFDILLRSTDDIYVVKHSAWWTLRDTLALFAFVIGIILVVALLDIVQKRNVREQTRIIRESEQKFRDLAEIDALTGLPNRLTLQERIADCLAICDREHVKAAILTIDIDRFKQINDTFGHLIGDECLKAVAERLKSKIRSGDTIARTGGEEFTVVIGRLGSRENARKVCSTLLNLFKEPLILSERGLQLTVSIGAAMYPDDGTESDTLRKRSDQALYEAKRTGRDRAVFASQELSESSEMATLVESKLREDLRFNRFRLYYQPICDHKKEICRFEALLRSPNMHLAKIGPGQFVPIAEECGLIVPLGRWVIREVCRQMAEWRALGMTLCPVAVNVSGRQLLRKEFVGEVLQDMKRYNIPPEMLELELTETTLMSKIGSVADTIAELAEAGLTFAIDDFGTGHSSLSRLNQLPIKALKIDASFVKQLELESGSYTIVRAVIQMAKSLSLNVVAEGIESQDQFEILSGLGCDLFQGYLIGKPMPADDAIAKVEKNQVLLIRNQTNPHWSSHLIPKTS